MLEHLVNQMPKKKKPNFEDFIEQIDAEIRKRKSKWSLNSIAWMDFEDVSQIIKIVLILKLFHLVMILKT